MKYAFMNTRDKFLVKHIKKHYSELVEESKDIHTFEDFCNNMLLNKAAKLDLLQIGENINHLSNETKLKLKREDLIGIVDIRNQVAHGYVFLNDKTIWLIIKNELPRLMEQIEKLN